MILHNGSYVTLGPNNRYKDYSWTDSVWQVDAINDGHVLLNCVGPGSNMGIKQIIVRRDEHTFYPAGDFANALFERRAVNTRSEPTAFTHH